MPMGCDIVSDSGAIASAVLKKEHFRAYKVRRTGLAPSLQRREHKRSIFVPTWYDNHNHIVVLSKFQA